MSHTELLKLADSTDAQVAARKKKMEEFNSGNELRVFVNEKMNKAGYKANIGCGLVGRGGNARFYTFQVDHHGRTNGPTDQRTDGPTDQRTKPLIELRVCNLKSGWLCALGIRKWGMDGYWMPLPTRLRQYCNPALFV